jgi:hypothetical protein
VDRQAERRALAAETGDRSRVADAWLGKSVPDRPFVVELSSGESLPEPMARSGPVVESGQNSISVVMWV